MAAVWTRATARWQILPVRWQMTIVVAGLLVAALGGLGLYLDLSLGAYVEASSVAHLHQAADPIITRETVFHPPHPGSGTNDPPLLDRLAIDLGFQFNGPDSFAQVLAPDGTIVHPSMGPPGAASTSTPRPGPDAGSLRQAFAGQEVHLIASDAGARYLVILLPVTANGQVVGVAELGDSLARGDALVHSFQLSLLIGTIVAA